MALSKDRLERLIDRSLDVVVATDRKGTVVFYNDGAERMLGYHPDEIMGAFVGKLYPSTAEAKRVMDAMRSPEYGGVGFAHNLETCFLSKDGEEIPVAISGTLSFDDAGEEDGTIGFAKDFREILHRESLARLGEVAIGLSHEINNPLAVIVNQAALLENDVERIAGESDCSVETERLDAIRREVARISEILERLGEMVRTDSYETVDYIGPARMVDLSKREKSEPDPRMIGLRILVCDDDGGICRTMQEILEADGCAVTTAGDGAQALGLIQEESFDLVLSDVVMPNMDGYELYKAIKRDHPQLPILMMTAFHYDKDHIIKRSRMKGLEGVIFKKPVDPDRLREVIVASVKGEAR